MLVQALAEYADHYLSAQLNDAAWEEKPVPWRSKSRGKAHS